MGSQERRDALAAYLSRHGVVLGGDAAALDYAGGTGRLISDLGGKRYVFDISGETPAPGVTPISERDLEAMRFDLIVCAQMIEHASDPLAIAEMLYGLTKPGGYVYIEVPYDETWRDFSCSGALRSAVLAFAKRWRTFNVLWDIYGTAFRVKLKVLPPFSFVPVREHLNYFRPESMSALGRALGAEVLDASRIPLLGTTLLIRRGQVPV